jgi:ATP-binding cassette, subfamily B, multidrug efflux pump
VSHGPATSPPHEDEVLGKAYDARLVRRLLEFVLPETRLMTLSVAFMLVVMTAQLAQPYLMKVFIDDHVVSGRMTGAAGLAIVYLLVFAVEMLARFGQLYTMERTGQNVILALRSRLFAHFQRLDSAFFDRYPVGRLMTRVTTDVESLADLFASGAVSLLGDLVKLLAIVALMLWLDWRLALVTFTVMPILFVLSVAFRGRIRQMYREVRRRIARINAYLQEAIGGMLLVQLFRREAEDLREFETINRDHRDAEVRSVVFESAFSAVVELVGNLATAAIIWYGGGRSLAGALSFGTLVAFLQYTERFFGPIRDLSGFYAVLQAAMASLERIFSLLDTTPSIATAPEALGATAGRGVDVAHPASAAPPAGSLAGPGRIVFDAVRFSYGPGEEVLRDVSFTVEPGETVALVGATGAGKTTVIKLLIRLYDPTSGAIRLDGIDLRGLPLDELRRHIGVVLQDHFLVTGTIADNIAFGDRTLSRGRLEEAARLVHADTFIRGLQRGYDEAVRERGGNLSVGQKQLLSFARAIASEPSILVLDEATSSVDTETEQLIQDALARLLRGRTSIIVAHRLSTILSADRILVFHHGRLAEQGRHRDLLARRGIYHRLYQLQFGVRDSGPAPAAEPAAPAVQSPSQP